MRVEVTLEVKENGKRFVLEERRYRNKDVIYGVSLELRKVSNVGIFNSRDEAMAEKKRLLKKKHKPYTVAYRIKEVNL